MAHRDPERFALAATLRERYPSALDERHAADRRRAARPASRVLIADRPTSGCARSPTDETHLGPCARLEIGSVIIVPMTAAGTIVGALALRQRHRLAAVRRRRPRGSRSRSPAARRWRSRTRASPTSARGSPTRSSASCCRRACRGCRAGRWRRCTSRPARSTRSAATSTRSSAVDDGWAVVLGDVSGKGAAAAALTAEARHTIRTAGVAVAPIPSRASTCSTRTCAGATTSPSARWRCSCCPDAGARAPRLPRLPRRPSASDPAPRRQAPTGRRARVRCSGSSTTRSGSRSRSRSSPAISSSSTPTA